MTAKNIPCPTCTEEGIESITSALGTKGTLLSWVPFLDEDDRLHDHNPNTYARTYKCNKGHSWEEEFKISCPTCGV